MTKASSLFLQCLGSLKRFDPFDTSMDNTMKLLPEKEKEIPFANRHFLQISGVRGRVRYKLTIHVRMVLCKHKGRTVLHHILEGVVGAPRLVGL